MEGNMSEVSIELCMNCNSFKGLNKDNTINCSKLNINFDVIVISFDKKVQCPKK